MAAGSLAALILSVSVHAAGVDSSAPPLLSILKGELDREFAILKAKADPAPYYMAYEVTDQENTTISATEGALLSDTHNHLRGLDETVRIGSPQFDNYHPLQGARFSFTRFTRLSLDDSPDQIRRAMWNATNRVYLAGAQRLLQLKTDQQIIAHETEQDADFSSEAPATFNQEPPGIEVDTKAWERRMRDWSGEFKKHDLILGSQVVFRQQHEVRSFVNSEGAQIASGTNLLRIEAGAEGLASDGMQVSTFFSIEATDPAHLPADKEVVAKINHLADTVDALVKAPPAEPIVCPAILSGRAAAVFFHEIFGHRIEGHRQKDTSEGQTFAKMIGQKVLPDFISVKFDATLQQMDGHDLIGHYDFDDEGVKAEPVQVVDAGVLKTFLLSRSPVGQFTHSNGHGRRQPGYEPESRQSNLIVESSKQVSDSQLRAIAHRRSKTAGQAIWALL